MAHWNRRILAWSLCVCLSAGWCTTPATAQQTVSPEELRQLLERLSRVEKELEQLQRQRPPEVPLDPKAQRLVMLLESPFLGSIYYGSPTGTRFFASKLLLINLTPEEMLIKRDQLQLLVDGQAREVQDVPQNIRYHNFQTGRQHLQMQAVTPIQELRIPAGGSASSWVFFQNIPQGSHIPKLVLNLKRGDKPQTLDVNASQRSVLGLEVERIGPRNCLGLFTISGELNTINVGSLVQELDQLTIQKVGRAVIAWADTAAPLDSQTTNWLQAAANASGRSEVSQNQFPAIPATIRELHLAHLPLSPGAARASEPAGAADLRRIHNTEAGAIRAALRTAFETLPREELMAAIEQGPRLTRAAALASAAGRLPAEKLPAILEYADDSDPLIQQAALRALQHFGEPAAIDKLVQYTKKNVEPLASAAITSLAASRYAAAHQALLEVLKNEPPGSKKAIITVLSQHPRPIWSDAIYEFVKEPRSGLNVEALRALQQVGHPKLVAVLQEALQDNDPQLQQQAFAILVARTDRESEQIALNYTLEALRKDPPDAGMLALLNRVKDQRAVPLLLAQFDKVREKTAIIQTLAQIGDQTVADSLFEKYNSLQIHEKGQVLTALHKLRAPQFRELAKAALVSSDGTLISVAAQGLTENGGAEAVQILIDALDKVTYAQGLSTLCNALGTLATPAARAALVKARDTGSPEKRQHAVNALLQIRQRSPAFPFVQVALQHASKKPQAEWKEAIQNYSKAIELDPEFPEAYIGRADCYIRQEKFTEAGQDYGKALELDPFSSPATTGVCIVMTIDGKYAAAIEKLEAAREKFPRDNMFAYNSACVYGRAVEHLKAHPEIADREKLLAQYTKTAIADLKRSVQLGFQDLKWMQEDPDLNSLHDEPEFQNLYKTAEKAGADDPPK